MDGTLYCGNTEHETLSIKDFLERNNENACINYLFGKWSDICEELEIDLHYVRNEVDPWFQECYHSRKEIRKLDADVSCEMAERRREELLEKFFVLMKSAAANSGDIVKKLNIQHHIDTICNYQPGTWVNKAIECVEKENELMANFTKGSILTVSSDSDGPKILGGTPVISAGNSIKIHEKLRCVQTNLSFHELIIKNEKKEYLN